MNSMTTPKKTIYDTHECEIDFDMIPLTDLRDAIDNLIKEHGESARFNAEFFYESFEPKIKVPRMETDEEYEHRIHMTSQRRPDGRLSCRSGKCNISRRHRLGRPMIIPQTQTDKTGKP